jgi:BirA family biotin operon repressor/biotin-[acetyl-CoA-carboxylase] ligase
MLEQLDLGLPWTAGLPYRYLTRCVSTSEVLKQEAARSPAGTTVVADEQTGGRGRLGRSWLSAAGQDLTFSVLLRPSTAAEALILSLAAALAVAEVLEEVPGIVGRAQVKWPNDVLLGDRKVCGILLESCLVGDSWHWAVAGIGVNVNSDPRAMVGRLIGVQKEEWQGRLEPTSLRSELDRELARGALLVRLLMRLTELWLDPETKGLLDGLRTRDWLRGRRVEVLSGTSDKPIIVAGEAVGIGVEGELLVRDDRGCTVPVFGGEATVSTHA